MIDDLGVLGAEFRLKPEEIDTYSKIYRINFLKTITIIFAIVFLVLSVLISIQVINIPFKVLGVICIVLYTTVIGLGLLSAERYWKMRCFCIEETYIVSYENKSEQNLLERLGDAKLQVKYGESPHRIVKFKNIESLVESKYFISIYSRNSSILDQSENIKIPKGMENFDEFIETLFLMEPKLKLRYKKGK